MWWLWWENWNKSMDAANEPLNEDSFGDILDRFDRSDKGKLAMELKSKLAKDGIVVKHADRLKRYVEASLGRDMSRSESFKVGILSKALDDHYRIRDDDDFSGFGGS
jgi:hypothetical protein